MFTVDSISIQYDQKSIIKDFSFDVNEGEIVSIIGPNGSGKSTLLKALSRQLPYQTGAVELDGINLKSMSPKQIARKLCMLSQKNQAPSDMTVYDLVAYGRYPHKKWYEKLTNDDREIIQWAIDKTHLSDYQTRTVASLSGGESQRAWIAMALAQRPQILLLDEPTTYLDIAHQLQLLELIHSVNKELGMTIVMVLHDLNQASIYSDKICVIKDGAMVRYGTSEEVMTRELIRKVYHVDCEIDQHFKHGKPRVSLIGIAEE